MRSRHLIFVFLAAAFLLCGCEFLLSEARKIAAKIDDGDTDSGTDAGTDGGIDAGTDAGTDDDAGGGEDAGEELPGPNDIWVRLTVDCELPACSMDRQLIFYGYDGKVDKRGAQDAPNYYHVFNDVTFPFKTILKSSQNTLFVPKEWPTTLIAGGAYYDLQPGDQIAASIDPQNRDNFFLFEKGKINDVNLVLDSLPGQNEAWVELTVECGLDPCTKNKNLIFYAYSGTEDRTFADAGAQGIPDYYHVFTEVSFPYTKLLKKSATQSGAEKAWPLDTTIIGGAYYDTDPLDTVLASKFDPQDRRNKIVLKHGTITKVKMTLEGYPEADEVWVRVTIACDRPECLEDKTLRFYLYNGPVEPSWYPNYYHEWSNVIFPFHMLLPHSYTVPNPDSLSEPWPVGQVTGGAFYDMNPDDGYATPIDPNDRYNTYDLKAGIINYIDLDLDIDAGLQGDSGT